MKFFCQFTCRFLICFFCFFSSAFTAESVNHAKGAGIFIISSFSNKSYTLLAKRANSHKKNEQGWVNPGGEQDNGETLAQTAARETSEELFQLFNFSPLHVANLPCVTLETIQPRNFSYTMFFAKLMHNSHNTISHERLQRAYDDARDGTQRELADFAWLPTCDIIKNICEDKEFSITSLDGRILQINLLQGLRLSLKKAVADNIIDFNGELNPIKSAWITNNRLTNRADVDTLISIASLPTRLKHLCQQYPDHQPLVFYDIDNTLIAHEAGRTRLIEPEKIHAVFKEHNVQSIPYMGLTARPYRHSAAMNRVLADLEVTFTKADNGIVEALIRQNYLEVGYDNGIFYSGHYSKAAILSKILASWPAEKILCIFVDDLRKNTDAVAHFFMACNENIIGQVYHYISPQTVSPYSPNFPIVAKKDQQLVAKASLIKKQAVHELRMRFNQKSIQIHPFYPQFSQKSMTMSHLKLVLGKDFVPGISPGIIQENIVRMLRVIDKFHETEMLRDRKQRQLPTNLATNSSLQKILNQFVTRELEYPDHVVGYHTAPSSIGFVYHVNTEILQQLKGFPDLQANFSLRFFYDALQTPIHYIDNIAKLLTAMKDIQQQNPETKFNYLPGYNEVMLSFNWSLFGNYCHLGSSSLLYYLFNACGRSQSITDTLASTMALFDTEPSNDLHEYVRNNYINNLLDAFVPKDRGWILQTFTPKNQINRLTYISQIFGYEQRLPHPDKPTESLTPLDFCELFQQNPEQFEKFLQKNITSFNVASPSIERVIQGDYHKSNLLQGRSLFLPEIMLAHNTHMFSTPLVDLPQHHQFTRLLRRQVTKDVGRWLASKETIKPCRFGLSATKILSQSYYDMIESGTTGISREYQEDDLYKRAAIQLVWALYAIPQTMSSFLSQHYLRIISSKNPYFINRIGSLSSLFRQAMELVEVHGLQRREGEYAVAAEVIHHYAFNYPQQNFIKIVSNPFFLRRNFCYVRHYIDHLIKRSFNFDLYDVSNRNVLDILVDSFIYPRLQVSPSHSDYVDLISKLIREGNLNFKERALEINLLKPIGAYLNDHFSCLYGAVANQVAEVAGLDMKIINFIYQKVQANLKSYTHMSITNLQSLLTMIESYLSHVKADTQLLMSIRALHSLYASYAEDYLDLYKVHIATVERQKILSLIEKITDNAVLR